MTLPQSIVARQECGSSVANSAYFSKEAKNPRFYVKSLHFQVMKTHSNVSLTLKPNKTHLATGFSLLGAIL